MTAVAVATDTAIGIATAVDTVTVEATETVVDAEEAEGVAAEDEDVVAVAAAAVAWNARLRSISMRKTTQVCWSLHLLYDLHFIYPPFRPKRRQSVQSGQHGLVRPAEDKVLTAWELWCPTRK